MTDYDATTMHEAVEKTDVEMVDIQQQGTEVETSEGERPPKY